MPSTASNLVNMDHALVLCCTEQDKMEISHVMLFFLKILRANKNVTINRTFLKVKWQNKIRPPRILSPSHFVPNSHSECQ